MEGDGSLLAPAPGGPPVLPPGREAVPVTLLTGFLGAGKTTLLNHILAGDHGLRVGVLVNDFGAINIDAALVESVEENTISLVNGCVCCEIRDDLVDSIEEMLTRLDSIDYVILEASGVADPAGIVMTFLDVRYEQLLRLDSITCVVDADGIFRDGGDEQLRALKIRQIAFADLVLLNKTDLVGPEHIDVIREWIGAHLQRIRIVEASHGDAPLDILLGAGRFDRVRAEAADEVGVSHDALFDRWSHTTDRPFSRDLLTRMVKRELPGSVYRCKGIVFTVDEPGRPFALQVVGRRVDLTPVADPSTIVPGPSRIVAIGRDMDGEQLTALFHGCETAVHPIDH